MTQQIGIQLGYSAALIAVTFLIHAIAIVVGRRLFIYRGDRRRLDLLGDTVRLLLISVWLFMAHVAAIFLWSALFGYVGLSGTLEEALYFALTCYTTLGFGDIVPNAEWRLLAGAASANGLLLFGLSTAVLVEAAARHVLGPNR